MPQDRGRGPQRSFALWWRARWRRTDRALHEALEAYPSGGPGRRDFKGRIREFCRIIFERKRELPGLNFRQVAGPAAPGPAPAAASARGGGLFRDWRGAASARAGMVEKGGITEGARVARPGGLRPPRLRRPADLGGVIFR